MRLLLSLAAVLALTTLIGVWWRSLLGTRCEVNPQLGMMSLAAALEVYRHENGRFPSDAEGLNALVHRPAGAGPSWCRRLDGLPLDLWGSPYFYRAPSLQRPRALPSSLPRPRLRP